MKVTVTFDVPEEIIDLPDDVLISLMCELYGKGSSCRLVAIEKEKRYRLKGE